METKSLLLLPVRFETQKVYNPGAGKVTAYGIITNHIRGGYWGIKYSFPDGETGESMIHASQMTACEEHFEVQKAMISAVGWAVREQETITDRLIYFNEKGDRQSVRNLIEKNRYINTILTM